MKTEIEIEGITYRIGDVLVNDPLSELTLLFIGVDRAFCEFSSGGQKLNSSIKLTRLKDYKIKKPTKLIKHEFWVNHYDDGIDKIAYNSESEARANARLFANFIECKKYTYEKEIEI